MKGNYGCWKNSYGWNCGKPIHIELYNSCSKQYEDILEISVGENLNARVLGWNLNSFWNLMIWSDVWVNFYSLLNMKLEKFICRTLFLIHKIPRWSWYVCIVILIWKAIVTAIYSNEELDRVVDASLRSAPWGKINNLACFWF